MRGEGCAGGMCASGDCSDVRYFLFPSARSSFHCGSLALELLSSRRNANSAGRGLSAGPLASTPFYRLILPLIELGAPGPEKGCWNTLWCATSPELGLSEKDGNGGFFVPVGKKGKGSVWEDDEEMCRKLWEWSEQYLRGRGLLEGTEEI